MSTDNLQPVIHAVPTKVSQRVSRAYGAIEHWTYSDRDETGIAARLTPSGHLEVRSYKHRPSWSYKRVRWDDLGIVGTAQIPTDEISTKAGRGSGISKDTALEYIEAVVEAHNSAARKHVGTTYFMPDDKMFNYENRIGDVIPKFDLEGNVSLMVTRDQAPRGLYNARNIDVVVFEADGTEFFEHRRANFECIKTYQENLERCIEILEPYLSADLEVPEHAWAQVQKIGFGPNSFPKFGSYGTVGDHDLKRKLCHIPDVVSTKKKEKAVPA